MDKVLWVQSRGVGDAYAEPREYDEGYIAYVKAQKKYATERIEVLSQTGANRARRAKIAMRD
jgi:hypothetical protein